MTNTQIDFDFDGATYERQFDHTRLKGLLRAVLAVMADGEWRTLGEIGAMIDSPEASLSARLRDLRKSKFGGFTVERRARGPRRDGLFEYRVSNAP